MEIIILTRYVPAAAAVLVALASVSAAAQESPPATETHEVPIDQQAEVAASMADHEAVAQRFDAEAAVDAREVASMHRNLLHKLFN